MTAGKGRNYCGEHASHAEENKDLLLRKRIPCPLDTKHTVFEDQLDKHLKKCNVTKKKKVDYYAANINSGIKHNKTLCEKLPLRMIPKAEVQKCINMINSYFKGNSVDIKNSISSEVCLENEIKNKSCNFRLRKHLHQQSSLIGNLRNADLLTSDTIFLEFGAGRGMLSHWIQKSMQDETNIDFLLVDKASNRYKADSYHKGPSQGPRFHRVQIDIEHLHLDKVPLISKSCQQITGVSKHLCGSATDLALRCFLNSPNSGRCSAEDRSEAERRSTKKLKMDHTRIRGLLFALCCHHCCSWASYVGRQFLENLGFTPYYFHILCCLSSWATCGSRKEERARYCEEKEDEVTCNLKNDCSLQLKVAQEHDTTVDEGSCIKALGFAKSDSEEIGRCSKRLLDAGRVWYLKQFGLDASLLYYVDRSVSLENVALLAWNKNMVRNKGTKFAET